MTRSPQYWVRKFRTSLGRLSRQAWLQTLAAGWAVAVEAGTHGYAPDVKRRLMIMNMIAYLIAASTLGYAIQHALMDFDTYAPVIYLNLALVPTAFAVPFSHRFGDMAGGLVILLSEFAALVAFSYYMGRDAGIHLQYFIVAAATFVVFGLERWKIIIPMIAIGLALQLYSWFAFPQHLAVIKTDPEVLDSIFIQAAATTMVLTAACVYYAFSLVETAKAEVDALLRNILPDGIVARLKAEPGSAIADNFDDASILFSDISGFVPLARQLGAAKIVSLLNEIVSEFDRLAQKHGVEKIKTIGDAYMVAAGLPEPVPDHTLRLARMGLDMMEVIARLRRRTGIDLNVRIGLASGPVMAGVIGTKKFSYDVWGDTVNLAARLENKGAPGRIHVCPNCRGTLDSEFEFESRGEIEIKGVGLQQTWFILDEAEAARKSPPPAIQAVQ